MDKESCKRNRIDPVTVFAVLFKFRFFSHAYESMNLHKHPQSIYYVKDWKIGWQCVKAFYLYEYDKLERNMARNELYIK